MLWSPILTFLALSALAATLGLLSLTIPYLVVGTFTLPFVALEVTPTIAYIGLFFFRYWRLFIHTISYYLYRPAPRKAKPRYNPWDVTVVCPTIEPYGDVFMRCCETICLQSPAAFYIVVGRADLVSAAEAVCADLRIRYPNVDLQVHASPQPGKRIQIDHIIPRIQTDITITVDDHVFWPVSKPFLTSVLAAFEDPNVALVGTNKRVTIDPGKSWWDTFWNMIGAIYLERHNFEITATTSIDGGVFAISGRTQAILSSILHNPEFRYRYLNETFGLLGMTWGPLQADDDNFITRYIFEKGYDVRIQAEDDSTIYTTLGWYPKHLYTSTRWSRTTFRSNPRSLFMSRTWLTQPWSIYGVYIAGLINFALFWDVLLIKMYPASWYCSSSPFPLPVILWIGLTKLIKLWPYYRRHPWHIPMFPGYVTFAYYHSFVKAWTLLTFWNVEWSGRKAEEIRGGTVQRGN